MPAKLSVLASVPFSLALLAGSLVPLQAASNAALGRALGHPLWAALTSLIVSLVVLSATILVLRVAQPNVAGALQSAWWLWIGGVCGAVYVAMATFLPARLGVANFILFVMVGQVVAALLIDHFGLLGLTAKPVNLPRVAGVLIIVCGLVVTQWGAGRTPISAQPNHNAAPAEAIK
ncbi:DMT family transporter [Pseudomonas sp. RP23018S]|uniref:DMT family transporter n=1 Tax=Pseudomonas sp. RP23018S TaxID=3096037 RepID=UPI002ACADD96|nr:DMT family transporter [Pseudomonas sp. RP23018S]MDZ5602626.1 DMT family transporter [Pseudomonas sp. RP23018S]